MNDTEKPIDDMDSLPDDIDASSGIIMYVSKERIAVWSASKATWVEVTVGLVDTLYEAAIDSPWRNHDPIDV